MRKPTPISEILWEEFMQPKGISNPYKLCEICNLHPRDIPLILQDLRGVDARIATELSKAFGTTPEFWLNLQHDIDKYYDWMRNN